MCIHKHIHITCALGVAQRTAQGDDFFLCPFSGSTYFVYSERRGFLKEVPSSWLHQILD